MFGNQRIGLEAENTAAPLTDIPGKLATYHGSAPRRAEATMGGKQFAGGSKVIILRPMRRLTSGDAR